MSKILKSIDNIIEFLFKDIFIYYIGNGIVIVLW
jgi:hypothetical protein